MLKQGEVFAGGIEHRELAWSSWCSALGAGLAAFPYGAEKREIASSPCCSFMVP